jgi:glycosyltransferase involved in cell wall biosynthesis
MKSSCEPTIVLDIELTVTLPDLGPGSEAATTYRRAYVLGRVRRRPVALAYVSLPIGAGDLERALSESIEPALGTSTTQVGAVERLPSAEPQDHPLITVVVPTRDRPGGARRLVESVLACDWPHDRLEVLIIDSASVADDVARLGEELEVAGLPVVALRLDRPGASAARNLGLARARGEIIAFTDDDVVVDPGWLRAISDTFAASQVDVVSGLVLPLELETPAQHWFEQYGGFSVGRGLVPRCYDLSANRPDSVVFPWGTAELGSSNSLAFRTSVLRRVGGFDEALGAGTVVRGGEDTELLRRVVMAGHTVAFAPEAVAWHEHRRDLAGLRRQLFGYGRGLTASIFKTLLDDPRRLRDLLRRLPTAVRYALLPSGQKNARKSDFPFTLTLLEVAGMATGPGAYLLSRRHLSVAKRNHVKA